MGGMCVAMMNYVCKPVPTIIKDTYIGSNALFGSQNEYFHMTYTIRAYIIIVKKKHKRLISNCSFNSLHAIKEFYRLLITFANSMDPDQDRQNVSPNLDPNRFTL